MKIAETVTYGGSALDRAAEIRGDAVALAEARRHGDAILLWRGKILAGGEGHGALVRLPDGHPVLASATTPPIFLGREEGRAVFAYDVSGWEPEAHDPAVMGSFMDQSEQQHPLVQPGEVFCELRAIMTRLTPRDAELAATAKALLSWHKSHGFCALCGSPSVVAQAGWQRDCPVCKGHHFPRTDPVVIMLITRGNSVLMGRSPGWPEGMYSLLAGFIEPGETLEAAVRREVFEEAGVRVGAVDYLASQPWPFPASLMLGCRGQATSDEIMIDPKEIDDARWFSREEIALAFAGEHPFMLPSRKGAIAHFILHNWLADRLE